MSYVKSDNVLVSATSQRIKNKYLTLIYFKLTNAK